MAHQDHLNIAVFIDFDNIEIGVKTTLNEHFDVGTILDAIKERGEVITKIAYADWTRAGEYSRHLTQHAIRLVQRNLTPGGDKNGADINLALDALEMAFTHPHINAYVIVGGDSDFLSLVEKLKQYDKKVFVVGGRAFTSIILQRNCHEFIAYENLAGVRRPAVKGGRTTPAAPSSPVTQAVPIVRRALKILADREVTPQTGLLKSTLLQLDSTFSERNYGASSFLDFVEKLASTGLIHLKHSGRSVLVELNEAFEETAGTTASAEAPSAEAAAPADRTVSPEPQAEGVEAPQGQLQQRSQPQPQYPQAQPSPHPHTPRHEPRPDVQATEPAENGVRLVARILTNATQARWPMYLRNVKQIIRAADAGFDERRYGFGGLIDLLRACQREGLVRMERDRRGGLRVFPGAALQRQDRPTPGHHPSEPQADVESFEEQPTAPIEESEPGEAVAAMASAESESEPQPADEPAPHPIDTTAALLGTARRKPARAGTRPAVHRGAHAAGSGDGNAAGAHAAPGRGARKTAGRKTAGGSTPRRSTRSKKPASTD